MKVGSSLLHKLVYLVGLSVFGAEAVDDDSLLKRLTADDPALPKARPRVP